MVDNILNYKTVKTIETTETIHTEETVRHTTTTIMQNPSIPGGWNKDTPKDTPAEEQSNPGM